MKEFTKGTVKSSQMGDDYEPSSPLQEMVSRSENDEEVVYDPMGYTGEAVDKRSELQEDYGVGELQEKLAHISEASDPYLATAKAMDTSEISIPVFTSPQFQISDVKDLPVARTLTRTAVDEIELQYDELNDVASADSFAEGGTITNNDDTITKHKYEIVRGVGRKSEVSDLAKIASNTRSPRQLREQAHELAVRRYEEKQAIQGTRFDSDNYDGLYQYADSGLGEVIPNSSKNAKERVRDVITEMDKRGVGSSQAMILVDHDTYKDLKQVLDNTERHSQLPDDNDFGISMEGLTLDNFMIVRSHGVPTGEIYGFNTSNTRFAMAEGLTQKALPPTDTGGKFATYNYGTLVSEGQRHVVVAE